MANSGMMSAAPTNGMGPNLFNDRRGQNPFQPVQSAMVSTPTPHAPVRFGGDTYLGQGTSTPNGVVPPKMINGHTYTRDNPNVLAYTQQKFEAGEKAGL